MILCIILENAKIKCNEGNAEYLAKVPSLPTPYAGSMTNILCYYLFLNQHGERMYLALDPRGRELGVEAY